MHTRQQSGSLYSMAFLGVVFGIAILVGLRAFPIYMNEFKVQGALSGLASSPEGKARQPSVSKMRTLLKRRWNVDAISHLQVSDIKFVKTKDGRVMRYDYEVRADFIGNWSLLIAFNGEYVLGGGS